MQSRSEVRPASRLIAAVLCGLLCSATMTPYAAAQDKPPAKGAPAKAPAKAPTKGPATQPATAHAGKSGATMTDAQKKAAARKHYEEGMKKLEVKDYNTALAEFKQADEILPAAAAKHKMALCYDGLGKVPESIAAYEAFLGQANPEKQKEQIDQANARLVQLRSSPGTVRVASDPADASVEVDGKAQMGVTPMELKLAPGKHKVKVSAAGYQPAEQDIEIKGADRAPDLTITLTKKIEPAVIPPPIAPPPAAPTTTAPPASADDKPGSKVPAYVVLGIAGAGAVVGTIFGIKALGDKSDFKSAPTTSKADDAERNALIADMAFGVAITLGVTGTVLLLSGKSSQPQKGALESGKRTMQLTPFVSPHSAGAGAIWRF